MTPLKPIENTTGVHGVLADRYPINEICAHPECNKPTESVHHIFGRPRGPHSDSFFVEMFAPKIDPTEIDRKIIVPHATGLCGHGTVGHHGDVDSGMGGHQAWIKLEDGVFIWYDRKDYLSRPEVEEDWVRVGPLNPQPGGREKAKPKRKRKKGADRENRRTISLAGPKEVEKPGLVWDEMIEAAGEKLDRVMGFDDPNRKPSDKSDWYIVVDALHDWIAIPDEASL